MSGAAVHTNAAVHRNSTRDQGAALIREHMRLVNRIAYHLAARLPASVEVDDLIQTGMVGLLDAAKNYNAARGASFETYAGIRIRGAMLDELRRCDWAPRSVQRKARQLAEATRMVENQKQGHASDGDVAAQLGLNIEEFHDMARDASVYRVVCFEADETLDMLADINSYGEAGPEEAIRSSSFHGDLTHGISHLPEREKLVMSLYYDEELNLREIGEVLGVSESRVCQIHNQALNRLRARLASWVG